MEQHALSFMFLMLASTGMALATVVFVFVDCILNFDSLLDRNYFFKMGIGIKNKLFKFASYAVVTLFLWTLFNLHAFLTILSVWNTLYIHFDWHWGLCIITTSWFERLDWWTIYDQVLLIWNKHDFFLQFKLFPSTKGTEIPDNGSDSYQRYCIP